MVKAGFLPLKQFMTSIAEEKKKLGTPGSGGGREADHRLQNPIIHQLNILKANSEPDKAAAHYSRLTPVTPCFGISCARTNVPTNPYERVWQ